MPQLIATGPRSAAGLVSRLRLIAHVCRPATSVFAARLILAVLLATGRAAQADSLVLALPFLLLTMAGFAINDIYDRWKDRNSPDYKPIAAGVLGVRDAWVAVIALVASAVGIGLRVASWESNQVLLLAVLGIAIYSPFSSRWPELKNLATAVLCATPLLFVARAEGLAVPPVAYALLGVLVFGRELYLDTLDFPCDSANRVDTLPVLLGVRTASAIAWAVLLLDAVVGLFVITGTLGRVCTLLTLCILLAGVLLRRRSQHLAVVLTRLALGTGATAIATLATLH